MFQKQVSLLKFLFPSLAFQQILCSLEFVSWLHFSCLALILFWVQKMNRSGMEVICLTLSLNIYKYVGCKVNLLFAFRERGLLERNLRAVNK